MGIVVDAVAEVLNLAARDIEDTPDFGESLATNYMLGMAKGKDKVKILLDIDQILTRGKLRVIETRVPLRLMFDYADKVRSLSQGRASSTMEPHAYAPAPDELLRSKLNPDNE